MNFTSIQMQQTLRRLEAAMPDINNAGCSTI